MQCFLGRRWKDRKSPDKLLLSRAAEDTFLTSVPREHLALVLFLLLPDVLPLWKWSVALDLVG
jgi:hypothetical protein